MDQQNQQPMSKLAISGFLLAIFVAPVGFVTSIVAWRKIRKNAQRGKGLAIAGIVIGALLSVPLLWLVLLINALGGWHIGNQAANDFKPIAKQIQEIGGIKLCDNGDSGYGIDNKTPWYQVYYSVPNTPGLTDKVMALVAKEGYKLVPNTTFINQLKGLPEKDNTSTYIRPYGNEQFNPKSDYLIGQSGNKSLTLTINRQTSVALYCGVKDYGKKQSTGNDAILYFSLVLPDRNQ